MPHKQISFRSIKILSIVVYEESLKKLKFLNYESVININEAYSNFILKLTSVNDEIEPCETKKVKGNSKEWFDSLVSEEINNRDKPFKKLKSLDYPLTRKTITKPYEIEKLTEKKTCWKKEELLWKNLTENIGKPKELWKTLKAHGLSNKISIARINALKDDKLVIWPKVHFRDFSNVLCQYGKNTFYKSFDLSQRNMVLITKI